MGLFGYVRDKPTGTDTYVEREGPVPQDTPAQFTILR